jgi:hypothetical protein
MQAPGCLLETKTTFQFQVSRRSVFFGTIIVVEINKEISVAPIIGFKHFEGAGYKIPIIPKIIMHLQIGFGKNRSEKSKEGESQKNFFHKREYCLFKNELKNCREDTFFECFT